MKFRLDRETKQAIKRVVPTIFMWWGAVIIMLSMQGCKIENANKGAFSGSEFTGGESDPTPTPTPTPTETPEPFEAEFDLDCTSSQPQSVHDYPDFAFEQWITTHGAVTTQCRWEMGLRTTSDPMEVPNPLMRKAICVPDQIEAEKANSGLQYHDAEGTLKAAVTQPSNNYHTEVLVLDSSTNNFKCRFTITEEE